MDVTTLSWALVVGGEEKGEPDAAVRRPKVQEGLVAKMSGLYRKEAVGERQPSPWARGQGMPALPCNR